MNTYNYGVAKAFYSTIIRVNYYSGNSSASIIVGVVCVKDSNNIMKIKHSIFIVFATSNMGYRQSIHTKANTFCKVDLLPHKKRTFISQH